MAERKPSEIRHGGYQGSSDPGPPTHLMRPQTRPAPDSRVSAEWPKGTIEAIARALFDAGSGPLSDVRPGDWERWRTTFTAKARAVLSSIDAVPKAIYDFDVAVPMEELREALDRAEARRESYRTALERIVEKGDQVVDAPDGGKSIVVAVSREAEECAGIARAALAVPQEGKQ